MQERARSKLKKLFGFDRFKGQQLEVIEQFVTGSGKRIAYFDHTGSGKSMCFGVAQGMDQTGITIVFSPLKALAFCHQSFLRKGGLNAVVIDGDTPYDERKRLLEDESIDVLICTIDMCVYSASVLSQIIKWYRSGLLKRIVIDEVHLICQWAHFRRAFKLFPKLLNAFRECNVLLLTATMTTPLFRDTVRFLKMDPMPEVFYGSIDQSNTKYIVRTETSRGKGRSAKTLADFIVDDVKEYAGDKRFIVFTLSKNNSEEMAKKLNKLAKDKRLKWRVCAMHSETSDWKQKYRDWQSEECSELRGVVVTSAYGTGMDMKGVALGILVGVSLTLTSVMQNTGRIGRDLPHCTCVIYESHWKQLHHRIGTVFYSENKEYTLLSAEQTRTTLIEMLEAKLWCHQSSHCRREKLLEHFWNHDNGVKPAPEHCCDVCENGSTMAKSYDLEDIAAKLLRVMDAMHSHGKTVTVSFLCSWLMGIFYKLKDKFITDMKDPFHAWNFFAKNKDQATVALLRLLIADFFALDTTQTVQREYVVWRSVVCLSAFGIKKLRE